MGPFAVELVHKGVEAGLQPTGVTGTITPAPLTVALIGTVEKTYDGTTAATLKPANYNLSGVIGSDAVTANDPTSGTYDTPDVGTGKTVTVGGLTLVGADAGNYTLASTTISAPIGVIDPATLVAPLQGRVVKAYDGTTIAALKQRNYELTGLICGDNVTLNDPTSGTYDNRHIGINKTVTVTGLSLLGADAGNYVLESKTISAPIGVILPPGLFFHRRRNRDHHHWYFDPDGPGSRHHHWFFRQMWIGR